uniref:Uncharacterized protein n=1 Tax=Alexandrium monilatum TaxID=311494 RepID=A0A7S4STC1_9DINO
MDGDGQCVHLIKPNRPRADAGGTRARRRMAPPGEPGGQDAGPANPRAPAPGPARRRRGASSSPAQTAPPRPDAAPPGDGGPGQPTNLREGAKDLRPPGELLEGPPDLLSEWAAVEVSLRHDDREEEPRPVDSEAVVRPQRRKGAFSSAVRQAASVQASDEAASGGLPRDDSEESKDDLQEPEEPCRGLDHGSAEGAGRGVSGRPPPAEERPPEKGAAPPSLAELRRLYEEEVAAKRRHEERKPLEELKRQHQAQVVAELSEGEVEAGAGAVAPFLGPLYEDADGDLPHGFLVERPGLLLTDVTAGLRRHEVWPICSC